MVQPQLPFKGPTTGALIIAGSLLKVILPRFEGSSQGISGVGDSLEEYLSLPKVYLHGERTTYSLISRSDLTHETEGTWGYRYWFPSPN